MKVLKRFLKSFVALLALASFSDGLWSQSLDGYHRFFRDAERHPELYDPLSVVQECRRYTYAYPVADSAGWVLAIGARAALAVRQSSKNWTAVEAQLPAVWLCKARYVYNTPVTQELFDKALSLKTGLLGWHKAFSDKQVSLLRSCIQAPPNTPSISKRAFEFVRALHSVRSKELDPVLRQEIRWCLTKFPGLPGDTLRMWLADAYSGKREHSEGLRRVSSLLRKSGPGESVQRRRTVGQTPKRKTSEKASDTGSAFLFGENIINHLLRSKRPTYGLFKLGPNETSWGAVWIERTGEIVFDGRGWSKIYGGSKESFPYLKELAERAPSTLLGQLLRAALNSSASLFRDDSLAVEFAVNWFRKQAGLPEIHQDPAIRRAALSHALYAARYKTAHTETPGRKGFTGTNPMSRLRHAGWTGNCAGEIMSMVGNAWLDVTGWIFTLYHRSGILRPDITAFGYGRTKKVGVLDYACTWAPANAEPGDSILALPQSWVCYPYDGQRNVPTGWNGLETPDPLPTVKKDVGFPITVYPKRASIAAILGSYRLVAFQLLDDQGKDVPCWLFSGDDPYLDGFGIIPKSVLRQSTTYTAKLVLDSKASGQEIALSWSFETAAY